jgi:hypothetical protein
MLDQFLEPQLLTDGILDTVVFQQDGAPCHYAIIVCDYLDRRFPGRWIGRGGTQPWAARSPDITPLDSFLPGVSLSLRCTLIEELVTAEIRTRIIDAIQKATPQMLESVSREHFIALSSVETLMFAMWRQINSTNSSWHLL